MLLMAAERGSRLTNNVSRRIYRTNASKDLNKNINLI